MTPIAIDLAGLFPTAPRALPAAPVSADFALLVAQAVAIQPPPPEPIAAELPILPLPAGRHDLAGQDGDADAELAEAAEDDEVDAPIWLPATLSLPAPAPAPLFAARASQPIASAVKVELPLPVETSAPAPAPEPVLEAKAEPVIPQAEAASVAIEFESPPALNVEPDSPPAPLPPSQLLPQAAAATLPGILLQSAAINIASDNDEGSGSEGAAEPVPVGASQPSANQRVEAAGAASDSMLDTSRGDWMESMIERIDEMRAAGGERSAHMRLRPDALGAVEVRLRQDGETLHVSFAAENPAARQMLADATPRLAELAAARGLMLGDAGVGQGFGREPQDERPRIDEILPNHAPARAAETTATTRSEERIA